MLANTETLFILFKIVMHHHQAAIQTTYERALNEHIFSLSVASAAL